MTTDIFSRSILAGYDPVRLHAAKVLVVGVGALGQNVVQNLVLSGVGNLLIVDFDEFEDHNATRSPFFPSLAERSSWGLAKAPTVAARAAACATAPGAAVWYAVDKVQLLGDGPVRWADVVVSAVDNLSARAWLAERTRIHGKPMVEGGFAGPRYNLSVFYATPNSPCYRCYNSGREATVSCTQYALAAEAASVVPAIQTTAAVLGGLMSEQVVEVLHGSEAHMGKRIYGDIRRLSTDAVELSLNPNCLGRHETLPVLGELSAMPATLGELAARVYAMVGPTWIMLSEAVIIAQSCTGCLAMCSVRAAESAWSRNPYCRACGGPWGLVRDEFPGSLLSVRVDGKPDEVLGSIRLEDVGLRNYGSVVVQSDRDGLGLIGFPGRPTDSWIPAHRGPAAPGTVPAPEV